ncbi:YbdK family carboxylate-amine ligase [Corynebacterium hylobatis]|uniref:Putative glutamate--cysteine ligase 2 n=1 Tax=Corynebacterium hylobatis TaxID=1859290 RepID=A0A3S0AVC1_9CORY|nr:YbdK family carboxylate-amine ligase [Corynebacterium hylobatis]
MRKFGVEEELLLVEAGSLHPLPAAEQLVKLARRRSRSGHTITQEFKQEQIEVVSPPQTTLAAQLTAIRTGRAMAEEAAAQVGGRVVALPTAPGALIPHLVPTPRFRQIRDSFGITAVEQLTCGFHVHVEINSREEGIAVMDRIRVWLPAILALSANSPFWGGVDTGFASYRYQLWNRWPTAGPTEIFGSVDSYDRLCEALLDTQVPMDIGMLYFDARLAERFPTIEVRVADVCPEAEHAAAIAALIRALVETAACAWHDGVEPDPIRGELLKTWSWQASRDGVNSTLILPSTGRRAPAAEVIASLLNHVRPALLKYGEEEAVTKTVEAILRSDSGARRQREAYARRQNMYDVVSAAHEVTHHNG